MLKRLLIALALSVGTAYAQGPPCISILDTVYSMGPSGSQLMTGYIQLNLGQFTNVGGFTVTSSLTTLNITAKANNLSACPPPSTIVQANYTITTGGRTPVHQTTYWYVPNVAAVSGSYQLTSVPSGIVNVSGTPGVVTWVSGLNFVNVQVNDTPAINGSATVSVAFVQSATQLTLYSTLGTLTGAMFSDGPIERSPATINGNTLNTLYGPQGVTGATGPAGPSVGAYTVLFDGGGQPPAPGTVRCASLGYSGTISGWTIIGGSSGSIQFDVWVAAFSASALPTVANSIVASSPPVMSSAVGANGGTSSWSTTVTKGQTVCASITSSSALTWASLTMPITGTH